MAHISAKNLTKIYPGHVMPVDQISFEVEDGGFLSLLGPSGCGKSTILRMVAGLESVTEGEIYIGDRLVNNLHPSERDIAMVFQSYALYPHMTVFENIAVNLKLKKVPASEIRSRVAETARLLDLEPLLQRKPKALSGGQQQRVALGRAIIRKPKVFLLDEPLSNLDAILREKMRGELKALFRDLGATVIYVTHDQTEAMTMSSRIAVIHKAKIRQTGTPVEIYNQPASVFVANFVGSPRINIMRCRCTSDGLMLGSQLIPVTRDRLAALGNAEEVLVGIRPENVRIRQDGIEAAVNVIEPMGAFNLLDVKVETNSLRVISDPHEQIGTAVRLAFDEARLHFFDVNTEERIGI